MKAKVAFLHKPFDLRIEEVELPPLKPNQVLIRLGACGICGSDVECYEGKSAEGRYDLGPYTPGHEWGGKIVEVGTGVRTLKPGYKVTGDCVMACGVCDNCKNGLLPSACIYMREGGFRPDSPGGMGEYLILEEQYVHRVPDNWTYEDAAWVETFSIGYFGIWGNRGYIDASDDAIIMGAGPVGLSAIMTAKTSGAKVISVDPIASRRETALKYGADFAVDPTQEKWIDQVYELTDGAGGSVVVEASGNDKAIASLFDISGHSARVRLIGHSIGRKVNVELGKTIWHTLSITGSGGTKDFGLRTIKFMSRIKDKYDFAALNTHFYPFEKIHDAFDMAMNHRDVARKVMLKFGI
ncbi:MAG: alcohol dehydrogenase catalytic domain-containing protein [Eubacteriales bacterium]|nr:alcohol dehydrogenase catalytic domain-containing protein [Eubacteriales bacterium]